MDRQKYIEVLENQLYPFWKKTKRRNRSLWFQDDGAPCHKESLAKNWKFERMIRPLLWLAQPSDLNPIVHVWNILKSKTQQRRPLPQNLDQLRDAIYEEWKAIDRSMLRKLISSMRRRIQSDIRSKGFQSKY